MTSEVKAGGRTAAEHSAPRLRPHPIVNFAACVEVAGLWWLVTSAGMLLFVAALLSVQKLEAQALRNARLQITLQDIRDHLEADLALGFELNNLSGAQALLDNRLSRHPRLLAIEVSTPQGISLFNTDRGAIGERIPDEWLGAIGQSRPGASNTEGAEVAWTAEAAGDSTVGLPIREPFGEPAGYVSATSPPVALLPPWSLLGLGAAAWLALTLAALLLVRRSLLAQHSRADAALVESAAQRLADAQRRMDRTLAALVQEEATAS
jgi:hypothetical protein